MIREICRKDPRSGKHLKILRRSNVRRLAPKLQAPAEKGGPERCAPDLSTAAQKNQSFFFFYLFFLDFISMPVPAATISRLPLIQRRNEIFRPMKNGYN